MDSQMDCPFRDRLWNLPLFQPTAVHKLPRTHAGWGASRCGSARSEQYPPKEQQNHGETRKTAELRGGAHFPLDTEEITPL